MKRTRANETSTAEVLDRVLDKGIVIDAWMRVSLVGLELVTVQARVVVASIETYLSTSEALAQAGSGSGPPDPAATSLPSLLTLPDV